MRQFRIFESGLLGLYGVSGVCRVLYGLEGLL